jgi:hypothetical protein
MKVDKKIASRETTNVKNVNGNGSTRQALGRKGSVKKAI